MAVIIDGSTFFPTSWKITPDDASPNTWVQVPKGQIFFDSNTQKICYITDPSQAAAIVTTSATTIDEFGNALATPAAVALYLNTNGNSVVKDTYIDTDDTLAADSDQRVASQKAIKEYIDDGLALKADGLIGVKIYRALLTQSGTDAPTAVVLENNLGEVPTFSYIGAGHYRINAVGAVFTANKTFFDFRTKLSVAGDFAANGAYWYDFQYNSTTLVDIYSTRGDGTTAIDDALINTELTILIYS